MWRVAGVFVAIVALFGLAHSLPVPLGISRRLLQGGPVEHWRLPLKIKSCMFTVHFCCSQHLVKYLLVTLQAAGVLVLGRISQTVIRPAMTL